MNYFVYILKCINGCFYTGYTNDLAKRYAQHLAGDSAKYTRSFKPTEIAQAWHIGSSKSLAMQVEAYIKGLTRIQKAKLIQQPGDLGELFELAKVF
ncbi:MAG: GIY-YIG nuclease family protein [Gammaproteobacteria bacterium]|nr:GIY-YIG nuclease family protein [Gammaproteobacteria bacterium]